MRKSSQGALPSLRDQTVMDFGEQWRRFPVGHNDGFYGSAAHLEDTFGPLLDVRELSGSRAAEIGSGPGRFVNMLLDAGVAHVTALEPSRGFSALKENTRTRSDRITYVQALGEGLPLGRYDFVFSVGVLMMIPNPRPVVERALQVLKPGGRILAWIYAREGNEGYLRVVEPLRRLTTRLPDGIVVALSHGLNIPLSLYMGLCRMLRLPRHRHLRNVMARMSWRQRSLVIFDQLNPTYAKYYRRSEAEALLRDVGFADVRSHHRHGYSWAIRGVKPS